MSSPSHRIGDVSKGFSRRNSGLADTLLQSYPLHPRRFSLEWRSRETIKGDIPRRQESAELLSGRKPASRAWRFGEEISGSLTIRESLSSASRRGRHPTRIRLNAVLIAQKLKQKLKERLIDLCFFYARWRIWRKRRQLRRLVTLARVLKFIHDIWCATALTRGRFYSIARRFVRADICFILCRFLSYRLCIIYRFVRYSNKRMFSTLYFILSRVIFIQR